MFCPKDGSILVPKKEGAKRVLVCPTCGHADRKTTKQVISEKMHKDNDVEVVEEDHHNLPITDAKCPKCEHTKAFYWTIQTRAGDEAETKFFKCEKCKHTWRDYD